MSRNRTAYLFQTAAQWDACLFSGADRDSRDGRPIFAPQAPYSRVAHRIASQGAFAPAFTPAGELLWRDGVGKLLRALPRDVTPESVTAPWPVAQAARLVADFDSLWVAGADAGTLENFEIDSLTRRQVVDIEGGRIVDFAADEHHGLLILVERTGYEILQLGCLGDVSLLATIDAGIVPTRMAYLPKPGHVYLLVERGETLAAFERGRGTPQWTRRLAAFRPCFTAAELAADGRSRLFIGGADGAHFGGMRCALALDDEATLIDCIPLDRIPLTQPITGIAGDRGNLVVAHADGVDVFGQSDSASDTAATECDLITPLLTSPDTGAELRWQRADAWASLPAGATVELRYGWSDDAEFTNRARKLTSDARLPESHRLAWLLGSVPHWSQAVSFAGSDARGIADAKAPPLAFPLQGVRAGAMWLHVRLRATPRSTLPSLSRLSVSYADSAMLQQLPAVYRRTATKPGDLLGALVGSLEATSQELDRRIASLGSLVHPDSAPVEWLNELAEWLGLPWDDALSETQKRALVSHAGELATGRGTRAGLATLLESVFPGDPSPFRIVDLDVDFGFATLGGQHCRGSLLPAMLAGLPRTATVLSRKTILGRARLPCGGEMPSATRALAGRLRVDIAVDGETRRGAEPWLARLIDTMVPANLRVELRWRTSIGANGEYAPAPQPHLGRDAITGFARLPGGRAPTLWP